MEVSIETFSCEIVSDSHVLETGFSVGEKVEYFEVCVNLAHNVIHNSASTKFLELTKPENLRSIFVRGEDSMDDYEFRMHDIPGVGERWCSMSILCSDKRGAGSLLIIMRDISDRRALERKLDELRSQVDYDSLTGVYSRRGIESIVSSYLAGPGKNGRHLLIFCDLDNYKYVNNSFGHAYGDAVISETAHKMRSTVREFGGQVGRVGGDEFVIFIRNADDENVIEQVTAQVMAAVRQTFISADNRFVITASLGCAIYPDHGTNYHDLFIRSDRAMYSVKNDNKNGFAVYDPSLEEIDIQLREKDDVSEMVTSSKRERITDYIFRVLYESKAPGTTIPLILQLLGRHFDSERAFIIERSESNLILAREWCADGCEPLLGKVPVHSTEMQRIRAVTDAPYQIVMVTPDSGIFGEIYDWLNYDGRLDDSYIVLSLMLYRGLPYGYFGLTCATERDWQDTELQLISYVSRLISLFYYRELDTLKAERIYGHSSLILNSVKEMQYVVDPETYELLYANRAMLERYPDMRVGEVCYAGVGCEHPCEACPMEQYMRYPGKPLQCERLSTVLGEWTHRTVSPILWQGSKAVCLCSRVDVTPYKHREQNLTRRIEALSKEIEELRQKLKNQ